MSEEYEMTKAIALQSQQQVAQQRAALEKSPTDILLQNLLVEDTDLVEAMVAAPGWSYEALSAIEAPVLGLYGEASDVLEQGQALAAHLPAFTLETYPGCTHSLLWERTEALKARLARWAEEGA